MFLYSFLFFLPSRNVSKEFVLFDENTGRVYVTDKETYDEMKRNSFKNQQYSPHSKFPSQMVNYFLFFLELIICVSEEIFNLKLKSFFVFNENLCKK